MAIGESLKVEYVRKGKKRNVQLTIQPVPVIKGVDLDFRLEGASFTNLTERHQKQVLSGVLIEELDSRSRLARQGLSVGDVITGVHREKVRNLSEFQKALEQMRSPLLLQVVRGDRAYMVRID
jgi:S1-C subfamily serine protease